MADFTWVDVAVIGGGPGGLVAALAIQRATNLSVKVYERATEMRPVGAGLAIDINGLKALARIDPAIPRWFAAHTVGLGQTRVLDPRGKLLRLTEALNSTPAQKYGYKPVLTGWYEIQQKLVSELPEGVLELGHRFESLVEREDHVEVTFKDRPERVRCHIVVGADGYFSAVRQACRGDGPPDFTERAKRQGVPRGQGVVIWRARVPRQGDSNESVMWMGDEKIGLLYPISATEAVWTCSANVKQLEEVGERFVPASTGGAGKGGAAVSARDGQHALDRCLKLFSGHASPLPEAIRATDPSTALEHGLFARSPAAIPEEGWGRGRVTLIGDAAHPLRPTGQGLNTTLEDAVELAWHLQRGGPTSSTLRRFERRRAPRMRTITATEWARGSGSYRKDHKDRELMGAEGEGVLSGEAYSDFKYGYSLPSLGPEGGLARRVRAALGGLLPSPLGALLGAAAGAYALGLLARGARS